MLGHVEGVQPQTPLLFRALRRLHRRFASVVPFAADDAAHVSALTEVLAEHDETILRAFVNDEAALAYPRLRMQLAKQTRGCLVHPVSIGSEACSSCCPGSRSPRRFERFAPEVMART